ncbi:MAG: NAD(P)H-hydrate dehydratase [Bacteroidota bacterium]|nr:NAD(P)H-hydrate dehydratase [Bacteroidota bacterium]
METVVTSAEMQACDHYAIDTLKIPGLILMENAGSGVVEMIEKHFGSMAGKTVVIVCGKGNNGGDGYVVARHLFNRGAKVIVLLLWKPSEQKGDAKINFESIQKISSKFNKDEMLQIKELKSSRTLRLLPKPDIIIDAIFGTGFSGEVRESYQSVIEWINISHAKKVSIDMPSGVNADNGEVNNVAIKADLTVTMALKKVGLITGEGMSYAGKVEVVDISMPSEICKKPQTFIVGADDVRRVLPRRPVNAHKHSVGKIFVLAGSPGFTGAAAMTASTAMKAGAGAVILGTPNSVYHILAKKLTEVMVEPLPDTEEGTLSLTAYEKIIKHLKWSDVLICGPGISRNLETCQLIWKIVSEYNKKILIDADGLNNLSEKISFLKNHTSREIIITPHTGELSRLTGLSSIDIEKNRVSIARQMAKQFRLTLVLKGAPTVIADENGIVYINSTGNPGMASAGMGDILAGLIGGLWAQGMSRTEAAYSGVFLHGYAGDMARNKYGEKSLLAMDVQDFLYKSILEIENSNSL